MTIEWIKQEGDYAIRHITQEEADQCLYGMGGETYIWLLCRVSTGEVLGWDGGEPEDQTLIRDWDWVPWACAKAEAYGEEKLRAEVAELKAENGKLREFVETIRALPGSNEVHSALDLLDWAE